jgi:hypothetical protein
MAWATGTRIVEGEECWQMISASLLHSYAHWNGFPLTVHGARSPVGSAPRLQA